LKCRLIAISKNERRYLPEWIAYHLAIGFSGVTIYDNDSDDGTEELVDLIGQKLPINYIRWPSVDRASPQRSAYNHAIDNNEGDDFIFFIDIDEFVVPWGFDSITEFLIKIPADVSAVVVNWLCFGSSGIEDENYSFVIKRFKQCADIRFPNNKHVKSLVRPSMVQEMFIHHACVRRGRIVGPDFADVKFESEGKTQFPNYSGLQINHYQTKTFSEFSNRMARGNANFPYSHPLHARDGSIERFRQLDVNTNSDTQIEKFYPRFDDMMKFIDGMIRSA
jgi:glycosyltransferase involved in cell wall biosynthesis